MEVDLTKIHYVWQSADVKNFDDTGMCIIEVFELFITLHMLSSNCVIFAVVLIFKII